MSGVLALASVTALSLAGFCVVGMLFIGKLAPTLIAMALTGAAAGIGGLSVAGGAGKLRRIGTWGGALGVLAVAGDVAHYYKYLATPGNYYAWGVFIPYAAALALIAVLCARVESR